MPRRIGRQRGTAAVHTAFRRKATFVGVPQAAMAIWPGTAAAGSIYGLREDRPLLIVAAYVVIGNLSVHASKPNLRLPC